MSIDITGAERARWRDEMQGALSQHNGFHQLLAESSPRFILSLAPSASLMSIGVNQVGAHSSLLLNIFYREKLFNPLPRPKVEIFTGEIYLFWTFNF